MRRDRNLFKASGGRIAAALINWPRLILIIQKDLLVLPISLIRIDTGGGWQ